MSAKGELIDGWCDYCPKIDWVDYAMGNAKCPEFDQPNLIRQLFLLNGRTQCIYKDKQGDRDYGRNWKYS